MLRPGDPELVQWALTDWARALDGRRRFHTVASEQSAVIKVRFVAPGQNRYG